MCYSAQVWSDFRRYQRAYGAHIDFQAFLDLLRRRQQGEKLLLPKGMTDAFKFQTSEGFEEEECRDLVHAYDAMLVPQLHEKLDQQRQRLAKAEARLAVKPSKAAHEDRRIATNNVADLQRKLTDIDRSEHLARDDRIFSGYYCPVLTLDEDGDEVIEGFFEHVKRHRLEECALADGEAEQDVVLRFAPEHGGPLPLACLWSPWTGAGKELLSFALITDEPPPEVAAAGHDRCPIPLKASNVRAWLSAPGGSAAEYGALLEDKEQPYFVHQIAA